MSELVPSGAHAAPSTARNREPILEVLRTALPETGLVLEIAAGAGEHALYFAAALPGVTWLPTDPDPASLVSIASWRDHAGTKNLAPPLRLDASTPQTWPVPAADAIVNINMIHIAPWAATEGLMAGARQVLPEGGVLFLYGPYLEDAVETAPGNIAFDASLKSRDPRWGIRRLEDVRDLAAANGLTLERRVAMPANNLSLVFRKRP